MKIIKLKAHQFTKIAKLGLSKIKTDEQIEAIRKGDQETVNSLFQYILEKTPTFGNFLRRYISQKEDMDYALFSEEKLKDYLKRSFKQNGFKSKGSLEPESTTTLSNTLSRCLDKPVSRIDRKTCFLFFLGLGMDMEEASGMLKKEFLQADFDIRNPKEVIYLYCLKHHLTYDDVAAWIKSFESLPESPVDYINSLSLNEIFDPVISSSTREDDRFSEYLILLKNLSLHYQKKEAVKNETLFNPVSTSVRTYKSILNMLEYRLSTKRQVLRDQRSEKLDILEDMGITPDRLRTAEKTKKKMDAIEAEKTKNERLYDAVDPDNLGQCLNNISTSGIQVPEIIVELLKKEILEIPDITADKIKHRLDNSTPVTRDDLLVACFLTYTVVFAEKEATANLSLIDTYRRRRIDFEQYAESELTACGFHELYLLNPLELFLISCLFYESPLNYFMAVLKQSRQIAQEKKEENKKRKEQKPKEQKND